MPILDIIFKKWILKMKISKTFGMKFWNSKIEIFICKLNSLEFKIETEEEEEANDLKNG